MQDDRAFCSKLSLEISQPCLGITAKSGAMLGLAVEVNEKGQTHDANLLEQLERLHHRRIASLARFSLTAQRTVMPASAAFRKSSAWARNEGQPCSLIAFGLQSLQLSELSLCRRGGIDPYGV
jgi:hypothetical protein